jgi:membrane protein DedA with SNARE-associated domain
MTGSTIIDQKSDRWDAQRPGRHACRRSATVAHLAQATRLFVAHYGLIALFLLLAIEEAGVWLPLPGDLLILYFGYRAAHAPSLLLAAVPVLLTVTAAVLCGSTALYLIARRFRWLMRRFGRLIHLNESRLLWMERWLGRRGTWVIIPGRLVPGLRIPTTMVCGIFAVPVLRFLPAVAVAAFIWGAVYFLAGAAGQVLLQAALALLPDDPSQFVLGGFLLLIFAALMIGWRRRRDPGSA